MLIFKTFGAKVEMQSYLESVDTSWGRLLLAKTLVESSYTRMILMLRLSEALKPSIDKVNKFSEVILIMRGFKSNRVEYSKASRTE